MTVILSHNVVDPIFSNTDAEVIRPHDLCHLRDLLAAWDNCQNYVPLQGQVQPYPSTELRHMLDLCLYFIPAHRLKVCS